MSTKSFKTRTWIHLSVVPLLLSVFLPVHSWGQEVSNAAGSSPEEEEDWLGWDDSGPAADQQNVYEAFGSVGLTGFGSAGTSATANGATVGFVPQVGFRIRGYEISQLDRIVFYTDIDNAGGIGGGVAAGAPSSFGAGQVSASIDIGRILDHNEPCSVFLGGGTTIGVVGAVPTVNRLSEAERSKAKIVIQTEAPLARVSGGWVCQKDGKNVLVLPYTGMYWDFLHPDQFRFGGGLKVEYWHRKKWSMTGEVSVAGSPSGKQDVAVRGELSGTRWIWEKAKGAGSDDPRVGLGLDARVANSPTLWLRPADGSTVRADGRTTNVMIGVSARTAF